MEVLLLAAFKVVLVARGEAVVAVLPVIGRPRLLNLAPTNHGVSLRCSLRPIDPAALEPVVAARFTSWKLARGGIPVDAKLIALCNPLVPNQAAHRVRVTSRHILVPVDRAVLRELLVFATVLVFDSGVVAFPKKLNPPAWLNSSRILPPTQNPYQGLLLAHRGSADAGIENVVATTTADTKT